MYMGTPSSFTIDDIRWDKSAFDTDANAELVSQAFSACGKTRLMPYQIERQREDLLNALTELTRALDEGKPVGAIIQQFVRPALREANKVGGKGYT